MVWWRNIGTAPGKLFSFFCHPANFSFFTPAHPRTTLLTFIASLFLILQVLLDIFAKMFFPLIPNTFQGFSTQELPSFWGTPCHLTACDFPLVSRFAWPSSFGCAAWNNPIFSEGIFVYWKQCKGIFCIIEKVKGFCITKSERNCKWTLVWRYNGI